MKLIRTIDPECCPQVYVWVLPEPLELLRGALAAPVGDARSRVAAAQS